MTYEKSAKAKWYVDLCNRFEALMHNLGLPEEVGVEIKTFLLAVAKEQYMAGNRSGIRWAREQAQGATV